MDRQLQIVLKLQDQASKELQKVVGNLDGAQKSTSLLGLSLDDLAAAAKRTAIGVGALAVAGATYGVTIAAQLETAQVGISTLLGSTEKGAATMQRIKREAARTPFELTGLTQAVQLLASVTHDGDKAVDVIMNVGEGLAAMGKGQAELDRVIVNLQQIAALGHAATIDIKQFAFAGIPIYEMLQEQTGLAGEALSEFIENGGVTFDLLTQMFDRANDEGGRFFNAFQNQSGTFNQALSNMKDSIGLFLADIVTSTGLFSLLTSAMLETSRALGNYKAIIAEAVQNVRDFILLIDQHTGIVTALREAWSLLSTTFMTQVQPALMQLWNALQPFMPVLEAMAKAIGFVLVIALSEAGKAIANLITITAQLLAVLMRASAWIVEKVSPFLRTMGEDIQFVINKVNALIDSISRLSGKGINFGALNIGGVARSVAGAAGLPLIPFASGGIVTGPTPALVGEAGPEAIIPLSRMGSFGGGVTVNVYGDVSGQGLVDMVTEAIMDRLGGNVRVAI
ncbi:MAG: hypothetical protein E6Q97_32190 [Desulfurellales bacterium]|nr:MAG: hypothetical protein E6Q97_32190 [Desulfurellales bacterium]